MIRWTSTSSRRSPPMAAEVLPYLSMVAFQNALPAPGLRELIYDRALRQPGLLEVAAIEAILHGEQDRADAFLRSLGRDDALHTRALRRLIEGDIETAVKLYAKGLTAERKRRSTAKVLPLDPASVFLPLAYLLSKTKSRHAQAQKLIELADREGILIDKLPWGGWAHLRFVNEPGAADELVCAHPIAVLLEGLCTWWRGESLDAALSLIHI